MSSSSRGCSLSGDAISPPLPCCCTDWLRLSDSPHRVDDGVACLLARQQARVDGEVIERRVAPATVMEALRVAFTCAVAVTGRLLRFFSAAFPLGHEPIDAHF